MTQSDTTVQTRSFGVQPREIMPFLLSRAGITGPCADRIIQALHRAGFNFHTLRPGDSLTLFFRDTILFRLQYRQSSELVYRIDLDSVDCRVATLLYNVRFVPAVVSGPITSSVYQALIDLGEKPALISDFTDIFGWEIDFFSETQEGDSFTILVLRKFIDSTPAGYGPILAARYQGAIGDFLGFRFTDPEGRTDYYNPEGQCLRKTFLKSPLRFSRITSFFGTRFHPIRRIRCLHQGVDYAAPTGTPVCCVADGRVVSAGWSGGYGRLVVVGHANGYQTRYGHLSRLGKGIRAGALVEQGQVIGYVGSTGLSTGPHLHYEVRKFGTAVNPLRLNPPRAEPVRKTYLAQFQHLRDSLLPLLTSAPPPQPPAPEPH